MESVDSELRRVARAEHEAREVAERLHETSVALLEANQSLAQIPLLEFRLEEARHEQERLSAEDERLRREVAQLRQENSRLGEESERLEDQAARAAARVRTFEESRSWRLSAPLRRLRAAFRRG